MQKILLFAAVLVAAACTPSKKAITSKPNAAAVGSVADSRDGSSFEKAIVITEKSETTGVHAEYEWLKVHFPGYKMGSQSLSQYKGKPYDILSFETAEGEKKQIYFDISNFFGKF